MSLWSHTSKVNTRLILPLQTGEHTGDTVKVFVPGEQLAVLKEEPLIPADNDNTQT